MKHILLIALAGGIGTAARYFVGSAAQKFLGAGFPWGTFTVNIIGCLLFGWVWGMQVVRETISDQTRAILLIGFMGGFTTFSSFAFDNYLYIRDGSFGLAALNIAAQNILGLLAVWAGITLAKSGA